MKNDIYTDIATRTGGDIYIGVVGPVRTGKSTFIKQFMEQFVIPNIESDYRKERAIDELPQSSAGKTIMTTEPKFIPEEAVNITLEDGARFNVRMIDSVSYVTLRMKPREWWSHRGLTRKYLSTWRLRWERKRS